MNIKELIGLAKKKTYGSCYRGSCSWAIGIYSLYSLKKTSEKVDIAITKNGIATHPPYDSVATAEDATSGGNINIFSEGTRPNSSANRAKAEEDINVVAQKINTGQQNQSGNADTENKFKMRK